MGIGAPSSRVNSASTFWPLALFSGAFACGRYGFRPRNCAMLRLQKLGQGL